MFACVLASFVFRVYASVSVVVFACWLFGLDMFVNLFAAVFVCLFGIMAVCLLACLV